MATLASGIETAYRVRVEGQSLVNNSRANSGSILTTEASARTTAICTDAATWVGEEISGADSDDSEAVLLGVQYAIYLGKYQYSSAHSLSSGGEYSRLLAARTLLGERRRQEVVPDLITDEDEDGEAAEDAF
jgi:hypothetical protein